MGSAAWGTSQPLQFGSMIDLAILGCSQLGAGKGDALLLATLFYMASSLFCLFCSLNDPC